ncbi:MAG: hypothetical protein BGO49_18450 [Planctomycetales bacterium 71-10]|nr:MAG: hypothetical protein BGO49_18450 [Planctomycetales bacterium 71-10]
MTVVSNLSPLHYLVLVDCAPILPRLFGVVVTPPAVMAEMSAANAPGPVRSWAASPPTWLVVAAPAVVEDIPRLGRGKRGAGEKAAIALALELGAAALLIDDGRGIQEAHKRGLTTVRTLALIDRAAESGFIDDLPDVLDRLFDGTSFHAGAEVWAIVAGMKERDRARKRSLG